MQILPSVLLGLASILMGVFASTIFEFTTRAAEQLMNPSDYIEGVLNRNQP